jgi:hypothetical protein
MKGMQYVVGTIAALVVFMFLVLQPGYAFQPIKCGEESEYTIYGFLRNNTGMFTAPAVSEFQRNGNQLATERTWFRGYGDFKFNKQFRLWIATQLAYEPWYKYEQGNPVSENGGPQQHKRSGWKTYSEFDDINDVLREAYIEWKPNLSNTIKVGRQIAIWGEALTSRVGDVIHPDDTRFAFAFANLEDTRIPQWMLRGIHNLPFLGDTSFEWLAIAPVVEGQYYVNRLTTANVIPGQRFSIQPEDRNATLQALPQGPLTIPSFVPLPVFGQLNARSGPEEIYPDNSSGWRYGARTSTLLGGFQFGFSYFHTHSYDPLPSWGASRLALPGFLLGAPGTVHVRDLYLSHPYMDIIGASVNKQLPWPGVVRSEVVYSPNKPMVIFNFTPTEDGIVRRDWLKYLVAYDLTGFFYFPWHKDAAFDISLEHIGEWIPNASDLQYAIYYTKLPTYHAAFNIRISTSWFYNKIGTALVFGYDTFGDSGIVMPSISYTPARFKDNLAFTLQYIGIYGDSKYEGIGILKNKDMIVLTTQYNF